MSSDTNGPNAWLTNTLSALSASGHSHYDIAAGFWRDASAAADCLPTQDPRRAAALNNLALSDLMAGHRQQAIIKFSRAQEQWRTVEAWIETIEIPVAAGSSMFHFLLAAHHPDALAKLCRKKYLTLCAGAAAITDIAYDYARDGASTPDRMRTYVQAIQAAFGETTATAAAQSINARHVFHLRPDEPIIIGDLVERWRSVSKNTVSEMRPLVDAAYLTQSLRPADLNRYTSALSAHQ